MMGYARRNYGSIGMATEELNSGYSRKDAATEAFHWRFRHVSVALQACSPSGRRAGFVK
jgi:hypothetical protein